MSAMTYDNPTILDHYKVRVLRFENPGAVDSGQRKLRNKRIAQIGGVVAGLGVTAAAIANRGRIARGAGKVFEGAKKLFRRGGKKVAKVAERQEGRAPKASTAPAPKTTQAAKAEQRASQVRAPKAEPKAPAAQAHTQQHVASPVVPPGTHSVPQVGRKPAVSATPLFNKPVKSQAAETLRNNPIPPGYHTGYKQGVFSKHKGFDAPVRSEHHVTSKGVVLKTTPPRHPSTPAPQPKAKKIVQETTAYQHPASAIAGERKLNPLPKQPDVQGYHPVPPPGPSPSYATMKRGVKGSGKYRYRKDKDIRGEPIPVPEEWQKARTMLVKDKTGKIVKVRVPGAYKADMIPAESVYPAATNRGQKVRRMFIRGTGRGAKLKQRIGGKGKSSTGRPARMGGRDWGFYGSEAKKTAKMQNFLNQQANMAAAGKPNALFNKKIGLHPDQGKAPTHAFIQVGGKRLNYARTLKVNTGRGETAHIHTWADPKTGHEYFQTMQGKIRNLTGPMKNAHDAQIAKNIKQTGERVKRHRNVEKMTREASQGKDARAQGNLERTPQSKRKGKEKWNVLGQSMDPKAQAQQGELASFANRQLKASNKRLNRQPGAAPKTKKKVVRELPPDTVAPKVQKAKPEVGEGGIPVAHFKPGAQPIPMPQHILDKMKMRKMRERMSAINSFRFSERMRRRVA